MTSNPSPRRARRITRWLAGAVSGIALAATVLFVLFLAGIPVSGEFLRPRLEGMLSGAFGVPVRIEGPLQLRTGWSAAAKAGAITLHDPVAPNAPALAQATQPTVLISLGALLRGAVELGEVSSEQLAIRIARKADGRSNWDPVFKPGQSAGTVRFAGIDRLRIKTVEITYAGPGDSAPMNMAVMDFEGALPENTGATARGKVQLAGRSLDVSAASAPLAQLVASTDAMPVRVEVGLAGARATIDGRYIPAAAALDATVETTAPDADALIAALGGKSRNAGTLAMRGHLRVDRAGLEVRDLSLQLGASDASGKVGFDWRGERPKLIIDLAATRLDERPFHMESDTSRSMAGIEAFIAVLDQLASGIDLESTVTVAARIRTLYDLRSARVETHVAGGLLTANTRGNLLGVNVTSTLTYDARKPQRVLTMKFEGGRFSTKAAPRDEQQRDFAAAVGSMRGDLHARGTTPREVAASLRGSIQAKDLRLSWQRTADQQIKTHLASARIEVGGGKPALAKASIRIASMSCELSGKGAPLEPLFAGERWPLQIDLACPGSRLSVKGDLTTAGSGVSADGAFDLQARNLGDVASVLGLQPTGLIPASARGQFRLEPHAIHLVIAQTSIGRTKGNGNVSWALHGKNARHQVSLALSTADADQLLSLVGGAPQTKTPDPLTRELLPANLELPDLDFALSAATLVVGGETLKKVHIEAAPRDGKLSAARFAFGWNGTPVSGEFAADFRGPRPTVGLDFAAENVDFGAALARVDRRQAGVSAAKLTARASSAGVRVDELLAGAMIEAAVTGGRIAQAQHLVPGLAGRGEFSGNLNVAAGGPVVLDVRGRASDEPIEISLATGRLSELMRQEGTVPAKLRAVLAKTRIEGSGEFKRDSTGTARLTIAADRLDHLGRLLKIDLPAVGPYTASGAVTVKTDSISATAIDAQLGKSRLLGAVRITRGSARPGYHAELRSPVLHLEDLGLKIATAGGGAPGPGARPKPRLTEETIGRLQRLVRRFDAQAKLEVDDFYAMNERAASRSRITVALKDGDLRLTLDTRQKTGSATADIHLDARTSPPRLRLRMEVDDFEFGNILAALSPDLKSNGEIDLSLDVTTSALVPPFFSDAQGRAELAVYPRGLSLGRAKLWGLGILGFVQSSLDPGAESTLNCGVAFWNIKDGVARTDAFFADTTRVRVIGDIEVHLASGRLSGKLQPRAKDPQLFQVAPGVTLSGTLDDIKAAMAPASLITVPLRFFAPLQMFASDWLQRAGDSELGCREAFDKSKEARAKGSGPPAR